MEKLVSKWIFINELMEYEYILKKGKFKSYRLGLFLHRIVLDATVWTDVRLPQSLSPFPLALKEMRREHRFILHFTVSILKCK